MKYALMVYGFANKYANNTGNTIQSIAAASFLPQIDTVLSYWNLHEWDEPELHKIIMNGFYLPEFFFDTTEPSWYSDRRQRLSLLSEKKILPLFLSIHIDRRRMADVRVNKGVIRYLQKYQPLFTRDTNSAEFLKANGINAVFSGCLTLTLKPNRAIKKQDYIVVATVSRKVREYIKKHTDKTIYDISAFIWGEYKWDGEIIVAEEILDLLQGASCVITSRLHVALPCLALNTPVLMVWSNKQADFQSIKTLGDNARFSGMENLLHSLTEEEYLKNINLFNPNDPPQNKNEYVKIRDGLIKQCVDFIGDGCPYESSSYREPVWKKFQSSEKFDVVNAKQNALKGMINMHNGISLKNKLKNYINKFYTISIE